MPVKLRKIIAAVKLYGLDVHKPSGGSHWKIKQMWTGKVYPIPAHNGENQEIDDRYIAGLCRCFGLDRKEFKKKL